MQAFGQMGKAAIWLKSSDFDDSDRISRRTEVFAHGIGCPLLDSATMAQAALFTRPGFQVKYMFQPTEM